MYEIYVATGAIFVLIGLLTAVYVFFVVKIDRKLINTFATITTGIIYIYFATLLQENGTPALLHINLAEDTILLNTSNNRITEDLFTTTTPHSNAEFLKNYQEFMNNALVKNQQKIGRAVDFFGGNECLQEIFLQHALMIYAFVESVLFALNNCKCCKNSVLYAVLLVVLPVLFTLVLYYVVFANHVVATTKWTQQINLTTTTNNTEINNVVNNIYKIINNTKTTELPIYNNKQTLFENNCIYTTTSFKIYVFVLVILGYITTIFYLKTIQLSGYNNNKHVLYVFLAAWLPGVVELFTRTFLTEQMPTSVSNTLVSLGSGNLLLFNIQDALAIRKHNKNTIKPTHANDADVVVVVTE